MKKLISSALAAFILFGTITCTAAKSKTVAVKSIKLSKTSISIMMPTTKQYIIKATVNPKKPVKWTSSDKAVATVSGGKITPVSIGTCNITATVGKKKASCSVSVDKVHWSDGTYTVGKDIPAAEYILYPASSDGGHINIESPSLPFLINDADLIGREYVTLVKGETLTITDGKMYTLANAPKVKTVKGKYPPGMYKMGTDIPMKIYYLTPISSNAYFAVYKDSSHLGPSEEFSNEVSIKNCPFDTNESGRYLKIVNCTLSLSK